MAQLDLGDLWDSAVTGIGNIFGDWVGADGSFGIDSFGMGGGTSFPTPPGGSPGFNLPVVAPVPLPGSGTVPPLPPGVSMASCGNGGAQPVYKKVCGIYKWVYPKRRRRRQLLTATEGRQLTQLVGILGKDSQSTKAWIAAHPT